MVSVDEDDDVQDEDAEYLEFLAQQASGGASQGTEDEEDEEEIGEEILFESPLDNVDPYQTFEHVFKRKFWNGAKYDTGCYYVGR